MRGKAIVTIVVLLVVATAALAQTPAPSPTPAPGMPQHRGAMEHRMGPPPGGMGMPMDMGSLMHPPMELLSEWWKNPELAAELRLTDAQIKQLEQANLNTKLAMIDSAADGFKALTRAGALLDADQFDEAAFSQQVTALSTDAANLVKNFGQAALTIRRVLSAEQWKKLEALHHHARPVLMPHMTQPERPMRPMPQTAPPPPPQE